MYGTKLVLQSIWRLFAQSCSIWVAWVKHYLLKGRSFLSIKIHQESSWSWRKLLKLRVFAKLMIHHKRYRQVKWGRTIKSLVLLLCCYKAYMVEILALSFVRKTIRSSQTVSIGQGKIAEGKHLLKRFSVSPLLCY